MQSTPDFERQWLDKFSAGLERVAGDEIRAMLMEDSEGLSDQSPRQDVIQWSRLALERLMNVVDGQELKQIVTACACRYPSSGLQDVRAAYEASRDVAVAHGLLQQKFESFLREDLQLSRELTADVIGRGWGLAGVRRGTSIIATKIPKSGYLIEYLAESDPERRRQIYCHCPRIRDALASQTPIPEAYCYCGAGFYKWIWEEILQEPVDVQVLESVLGGGTVCRIGITLPTN